jgi:DNA mismatch repair protein MutL
MQKIFILPSLDIQKIAAGQVVDRPVNIVKELLENSLDAGATDITVYVKQGGHQLVRVVDNGSGMSPQDAQLCVHHHATSKIRCFDDLNTINTFGFRGEALASISAVSTMHMTTKTVEDVLAYTLIMQEGVIIDQKECAGNQGTDISIQDLFNAVPVRKKFLRSPATEWRAIATLFQAFSLDYPQVRFTLFHDDRLLYKLDPVIALKKRWHDIFGADTIESMLEVEKFEDQSIGCSGLISPIEYSRYDRNSLFFFVNKRWVKNYKLCAALCKGYVGIIKQDRFPAACIFLEVPHDQVDINVHPKKEEVCFLHPQRIERLVTAQVTKTLQKVLPEQFKQTYEASTSALWQQAFKEVPDYSWAHTQPHYRMQETREPNVLTNGHEHTFQESSIQEINQGYEPLSGIKTSGDVQTQSNTGFNTSFIVDNQELVEQSSCITAAPSHKIIGQFFNTYILCQLEDGLLFIDQHAAHERIIYEEVNNQTSIDLYEKLLFKEVITLSQQQADILERLYESIHEPIGMILSRFGKEQIIISHVSPWLRGVSLGAFLIEFLNKYEYDNSIDGVSSFKHAFCAQIACKAAIKSGDILSHEKMSKLIESLLACKQYVTCPHGRPTTYTMGMYELERKFKRRV